MTAILVTSTVVIALVSLGVAVWTVVQTRKETKRHEQRDQAE